MSAGLPRPQQPDGLRRDPAARTLSYYVTDASLAVDDRLVRWLIAEAERSGGDSRISLHQSPDDPFHQMLILQRRGRYFRPHRHAAKGESHHIVRGSIGVLVFDEAGGVAGKFVAGPGQALITRIGTGLWHTVLPLTATVIYHEVKPGPYLAAGDSVYPSWAPDGQDGGAAAAYQQGLYARFEGGTG
jgi:cupin fold WbuC family metalloprotein